jgi:hypothetical protein
MCVCTLECVRVCISHLSFFTDFQEICLKVLQLVILRSYLLRGLSPQANYTDERPPLVGEVSANF